jgi:type I restriction enzyme R subunit
MTAAFGAAAATNVTCQSHTVDGLDLARVHAKPSGFPVDAKVTIDKRPVREEGGLLHPGR